MDLQYQKVGVRCLVIVVAFAGILAFAGCGPRGQLRPSYLPGEARLVGGGLVIEWEAPVPGTVHLMEKQTGRLVQTFTLEAGEAYHFAVESIVDAEELEDMLGIEMAKAQFLLYFTPAVLRKETP